MAVLRLVVGVLVAMLGYGVARWILDRVGLERRFTAPIWRYSLSQFGEVILTIMTIVVVVLIAGGYALIRAFFAGA